MITPTWNTGAMLNRFRLTEPTKKQHQCRKCQKVSNTKLEQGFCKECNDKAWDRLINDLKQVNKLPTHFPQWWA